MPNWCENYLSIEGKREDLMEIKQKYTNRPGRMDDDEQCIKLELISPTPPELNNFSSPNPDKKMEKEFKKKYGAVDWYNWNNKNWGTKWDTQGFNFEDNITELVFSFNTAWGPCLPVIKKLAKLFPNTKIEYSYAEPGCCFAGKHKFRNGKQTSGKYTEDIHDQLFKDFGINEDEEDELDEENLNQERLDNSN